MPQYPKNEVRENIRAAALEEIARLGYKKATVAGIAKAAGVATGNVYHYFHNKEALFHAVLPESFLTTLLGLIDRKVRALNGVDDVRTLPAESDYRRISAELLEFCVENRLQMIVLTGGIEGSPYEGFGEKVVQRLRALAVEYYRSIYPDFTLTQIRRFDLELAYRSLLRALAEILQRFKREPDLREALTTYMQYHQAGLGAMFEKPF